MKLIAYLVPDDFEDWKMPQGIEFSHTEQDVPEGALEDMVLWMSLGAVIGLAFWGLLRGGK